VDSHLKIVRHDTIPDQAAPAHAAHAGADRCPNCDAPATSRFCARCGESLVVHSPSVAEFVHEFIGHYVALEGKLWETLRLLMFKPGGLTADYLRGRRIRYIDPLRLYLTLSLVMFGLIKLFGVDLPQITLDGESVGVAYVHSVPDAPPARGHRTVKLEIKVSQDGQDDTFSIDRALMRLGSVDAAWMENAKRFIAAPPAEKAELINHGFLANLPYMLIGALPLFALYLKLLYWRSGRRYGEHLVFALHVSAFAFLLASAMILVPGNVAWLLASLHSGLHAAISPWDWLQLLPVAWIVAYVPAAVRRVYGGSRRAAWVRSAVLMSVHLLVIVGLVVGAEAIAIFKHG
jgi:hypothetical protein